MKFDKDISPKLVRKRRAPRGARGLKYVGKIIKVLVLIVAPREGRVD